MTHAEIEMTQVEWSEMYGKMKAISERIHESRLQKIVAMCKEAGLAPEIWSLHLHNCMVAYNRGKPWPNVNYDIAKKAYYLEKSGYLYEASRIVNRWVKKH